MKLFWDTLQIVMGTITPLLILMIAIAAYRIICVMAKESDESEVRRDLLKEKWVFVRKENCPSPHYERFNFRNTKTGDHLEIAIERKNLL